MTAPLPKALVFHTLDVFTETRFGGNPLAVVLDADGLKTGEMQRIAREFNLSETVFVEPPGSDPTQFTVRIFTPTHELPFAGHPTVGTACLLAELGLAPQGEDVRFVLNEAVGPVPVRVRRLSGQPPFGQLSVAKLPEYGPAAPSRDVLASLLGLKRDDLLESPGPRAVSCGVPFVLVPVRAPEILAGIEIDTARWRAAFAAPPLSGWSAQVLVYAHSHLATDSDWQARMFAPELGVIEDPATGSAAVALAGALATESEVRDGQLGWVLAQGLEMGRPSRLLLEADKQSGAVTAVRVGGHAVRVSSGTLLR
jgi:trans-2,3-dihydro-3-hydroxyanthranilate isomerase